MTDIKTYDVAIIGAGPAGLTAAMYCARAGLDCAMVEAVSFGGQLAQTEHLENYPGFNQSMSGYELSEIIHQQAEGFGAKTIYDEVTSVDFQSDPKVLTMAYGTIQAKVVIVATGARPAKLGLPNEDALKGSGISYCATCDGNFFKGKDVVIVGGGDTAAADAIYLSRICNKIYMIVRRDELRATAIYHEKLDHLENVEIVWNTVVEEALEDDGMVSGVKLRNRVTGEESELPVSAIFIAVGTTPNTEFLDGKLELDQTAHIVADEMGKTSVPGVFAAGDVRTKVLRQVSTGVGDGANAADAAADYLLNVM
ncbi:MAG: thioredoxin-disulfide reductase [Eggerthellaceae bacterium]|nr:thioredoxin-disulfide reductase [Eggerthellaceae bacterium]